MAEISYRFTSTGAQDVTRAFASISLSAQRATVMVANVGKAFLAVQKSAREATNNIIRYTNELGGNSTRVTNIMSRQWDQAFNKMEADAKQAASVISRELDRAARGGTGLNNRTRGGDPLGQAGGGKKPPGNTGAFASMAGMFRGPAGLAATYIGYKTLSAGTEMLDRQREYSLTASRVSNLTNLPGKNGASMSASDVSSLADNVVASTPGLEKIKVLEAMEKLMDRFGDVDAMKLNLPTVAKLGLITGDSAEGVSQFASSLLGTGGVSKDGLPKVLKAMYGVGKTGSVPFKEFSAGFNKVLGAAKNNDFIRSDNTAVELMGMFQYMKPNVANARQTLTSMQRAIDRTVMNSEKFGVPLRDENGNRRDLRDVMINTGSNIIDKAGGDEVKLATIISKEFGLEAKKTIGAIVTDLIKFRREGATPEEASQKLKDKLNQASNTAGSDKKFDEDVSQTAMAFDSQMKAAKQGMDAYFGPSVTFLVEGLMMLGQSLAPLAPVVKLLMVGLGALARVVAGVVNTFFRLIGGIFQVFLKILDIVPGGKALADKIRGFVKAIDESDPTKSKQGQADDKALRKALGINKGDAGGEMIKPGTTTVNLPPSAEDSLARIAPAMDNLAAAIRNRPGGSPVEPGSPVGAAPKKPAGGF